MADFTFVTTNELKVIAAREACDRHGITFDRQQAELVELQADAGETIAQHKAEQAYALYQKPIFITDDSWLIPGLNGWPGPYMKYMNQWLAPDDFIRLTRDLADRSIILRQIVVYQDAAGQKTFSRDITGTLLKKPAGSAQIAFFSVISFDGGKHSAAEINATGYSSIQHLRTSWDDLCEWLKGQNQ